MRVWTLCLVVSLGACAQCQRRALPHATTGASGFLPPGNYDVELPHGDRTRYALVHVPPQATGGAPLPVVLSFHGAGGAAEQHRDWTGMDAVADEEGFIAVYPGGNGRGRRRLLTWNAGGCCGLAARERIDDVGFVVALLGELAAQLPVDATRVYATGMSNGAMMSYQLALSIPERIAAIAPVAGAPQSDAPPTHVPLLHVHSVDDPRAYYGGGLGPPFPFTDHRVEHAAVEPAVQAWAHANGCSGPWHEIERRAGPAGTPTHTATLLGWDDCAVEVALWKLTGAGHVWPGPPEELSERILGPATDVIDASRIVWRFFARHRRADAPAPGRGGAADWRRTP